MDKTNPEKSMKELTMLLMYLSRFNEGNGFGSSMDMAWKGLILTLSMSWMRKTILGKAITAPNP